MEQVVPLQFHPTLVIFVDATGALAQGQSGAASQFSILEHFRGLCARLDPVLYRGFALLTIDEGSNDAQPYPLDGSAASSDNAETLLRRALRDICDYRSGEEIKTAGYLPMVYPQIFIVAPVDSGWISQVAGWVNTALGYDRSLAHISYLLIEEPTQPPQAITFPVPWRDDLLAHGNDLPLVNFCHIYEERGQSQRYMQAPDMRYSLAEALFALVATGISGSSSFVNATECHLSIASIEERIGSLGTSLIHFPRAAAGSYCVDEHAAALVQGWIESIDRPYLSKDQQEQLSERMREEALQDARRISADLEDRAPRPGYSQRRWPDLAFLQDDILARRLADATHAIFQNFQNYKEWKVDSARRQMQAQQALQAWRGVGEAAWLEARRCLEQRVNEKIDAIWLDSRQGPNAAAVYAAQLDMLLERVRDSFTHWRMEHRKTYESELQRLQQRSDGPWINPPGATSLFTQQQGAAPASPSAANVPPGTLGASVATGAPPGLNASPVTASSQAPQGQSAQGAQAGAAPSRQQIIKNLAARVPWLRSRLPTTANIVVAAALAAPTLALLALCILPPSLAAAPLFAGLVAIIVAAVCVAGGWLYRQWRLREVRQAEEDLLCASRLYFAYQCEWWEDQLRIIVLSPLIGRVRRIRRRLENFAGYLQSIADELHNAASSTESDLFDSPVAYRDVLVANRQILSRQDYSLADLNREIERQHQRSPREPWHRTPASRLERMREFFAGRRISMIEITQDELITHLREFCGQLVIPYLQGELVEIAAALQAGQGKQILKRAIERSSVLYRPYQNTQGLIYYICACDEQRAAIPAKALPDNAIMIGSREHEWMLLACFWTGGARTRWSNDGSAAAGISQGIPATPQW